MGSRTNVRPLSVSPQQYEALEQDGFCSLVYPKSLANYYIRLQSEGYVVFVNLNFSDKDDIPAKIVSHHADPQSTARMLFVLQAI